MKKIAFITKRVNFMMRYLQDWISKEKKFKIKVVRSKNCKKNYKVKRVKQTNIRNK